MATTTDLAITLLETGQTQKESTVNQGLEILGRAVAGLADLALTTNYALSTAEARCAVLRTSGNSAPLTVTVPASRQLRAVINTGTANVLVGTATGVKVTVGAASSVLVWCDGTDCTVVGPSSAGRLPAGGTTGQRLVKASGSDYDAAWASDPFDVLLSVAGKPSAAEGLARWVFARTVTFPTNFAGSQASAGTPATAQTVFTLAKNGVQAGTVTFAAGAGTASFASTGGAVVTLAAGDVLTLTAPNPADATLADLAITLAGTR